MNGKMTDIIRDTFCNNEDVAQNPTCYFYDLSEVTRRIHNVVDYKPENVSLYYAMKANPNKEVVAHVLTHSEVKGIEIASTGELETAVSVGLEESKVLFTGPGKTLKELERVISSGIRFINVESLVEAIRIDQIAEKLGVEKVDILLRVNIDYMLDGASEYMAGFSSKLGIDQCRFEADFNAIKNLKHLNVCGLHVFAADGVIDYSILLKYAEYVFKFVKEAEKFMGEISVIDFGGGLGLDYTKQGKEFDTKEYFTKLGELLKAYGYENKEIILELGKYIAGTAGYYVTEIIDIKDCKGMKHIVCAGGVNHMRLPIATDRKHPVYIIPMNKPDVYEGQPEVVDEEVDIEGPLCMTEDKISWNERVEHARIGDLVVLTQSGAYCYSASTLWFLSHEMPLEIIVR